MFKMGAKNVDATKPTQPGIETDAKKTDITPEQLKVEQQKEVETRMAKWTPRQKSALDFLVSKFSWNPEKLTPEKLDKVEKFAENPKEVMPSASYNKTTGKFEAAGKVEAYH